VAVKKEKNGFSMWSIPYQDTPNKKKKIQKIFFLKKGKTAGSTRLKPKDAVKRLLANCLFSTMHPEIAKGVLEKTVELAEKTPCYELEFPLNVWLDKELEKTGSPEEKREFPRRTNLRKGLDISGLHESLILTWECNLRCHHCRPYLPQDGTFSFDVVKKHIDTLVHKGSLFLHFTGGEPLVHKDFWKIASCASQKNFAMVLHTNGTLITPEVGEKLKDLNFIQVSLTVLGEKARTHDSITGVEGSFEKTISALQILKEKGMDVVLSTTRLNENQDEIPGIKKMAKNHGAAFTIIPYTAPKKGEFEEFSRCYLQNFQAS
jgi:sulfatase maturation enzyme AslB (radical SAM superfamily)